MQRLYDFLRRHPTGVDSFWAVMLAGFALVWFVEADMGREPRIAAVPICVTLCLASALRRRAPEHMLLVVAGCGLVQLATNVEINPADFAMLVVIYTCAANGARWSSWFGLIGGLLAPTIAGVRWHPQEQTEWQAIVGIFFATIPFALAWVLGDSLRTRRAYYAQLEERAARLEREREAQAKVAVAGERARIARELHDVVAHNVSVMVVQADGAAYVLDAAPEQAKQALETISGTGRQALAEMRRLLGVLRTGEQAEGGEYVPQPGVEQLSELIEQVRGAGLPVDFKVQGSPRPLDSGVELTAYRIVQEALTNTRKHGGEHVGATVWITYDEAALALLIEDDGRGAGRELYETGGADGLGHGLIGMRERVGMVGGSLEAGPRRGGGFRVSVVLPVKR
ncbi:sensor histidine kinase [Streptomyces zagrosensis]|uniref:histidine kinase n=1 Tax=Streptomyces zagrosensis TaxID=1042984 RepID=A0A7W9QI54_9ACTN|nr:sensor histidine kinase [Streptomyces zagrosensis]MBB5939397.1 signal transduction histidine kinase [Streptomyces zagrosensis]